jgi:HAD superfamily hydrolase (TIGR01509 family)
MKGVIFDMDGTIIDSLQAHLHAFEAAGKKEGAKIDVGMVKSMVGETARDIFAGLFPNKPEDEINELVREKDDYFQSVGWKQVKAMKGAASIMKELKGKYKLAIGTSASIKDVELFSKKFEWFGLFDVFVGREHVQRGKPAPDIYLVAAQSLKIGPEDCTVVGDATYDMMAAKAAGMRAIGVTTGVMSRAELLEAGADAVCRDLDEVARLL